MAPRRKIPNNVLLLYSTASLTERASASNDQALRQWFHLTTCQNPSFCNYDRYGSETFRAAELMYLRAIRPTVASSTALSLLLTSSGMAAFQIVLQHLLHKLQPQDTLVLAPYIYFEAMEQIVALKHLFRVEFACAFDAEDIISAAETQDARAVFLDPVANIAGLPTIDVRYFLQTVSQRPGWEKRFVVIDGTMISGGMPVFERATGPHAPTLLYHESATKYAQLGLDIQMAGIVIAPAHLDEPLRKIRRDTGGVLSGRSIASLPAGLTRDVYQKRLAQLAANAEVVAKALHARIGRLVDVAYPECWRGYGWSHGGALVTLEFRDKGLNNHEGLDACIELVLRAATKEGVPVTKGVSFGFSPTRVSASSSVAENSDPFFRISVGVQGTEVEALIDVIAGSVERCVEIYTK